jgi:hypothetical protein
MRSTRRPEQDTALTGMHRLSTASADCAVVRPCAWDRPCRSRVGLRPLCPRISVAFERGAYRGSRTGCAFAGGGRPGLQSSAHSLTIQSSYDPRCSFLNIPRNRRGRGVRSRADTMSRSSAGMCGTVVSVCGRFLVGMCSLSPLDCAFVIGSRRSTAKTKSILCAEPGPRTAIRFVARLAITPVTN